MTGISSQDRNRLLRVYACRKLAEPNMISLPQLNLNSALPSPAMRACTCPNPNCLYVDNLQTENTRKCQRRLLWANISEPSAQNAVTCVMLPIIVIDDRARNLSDRTRECGPIKINVPIPGNCLSTEQSATYH